MLQKYVPLKKHHVINWIAPYFLKRMEYTNWNLVFNPIIKTNNKIKDKEKNDIYCLDCKKSYIYFDKFIDLNIQKPSQKPKQTQHYFYIISNLNKNLITVM